MLLTLEMHKHTLYKWSSNFVSNETSN